VQVLLLGTGSEVHLCVDAYEQLKSEGIKARVVSMPSWELFEEQSQDYRESIIPPDLVARVLVEQASTLGWRKYVGLSGRTIGMRIFWSSAPLKDLQEKFGFTHQAVAREAKELLGKSENE
jgi:transketolase